MLDTHCVCYTRPSQIAESTHVSSCPLERVTLGTRGAERGHGVVFLLGLQAGATGHGDLGSPRGERQAVWLLGGAGVEAHIERLTSMRWSGLKVLIESG